jgi:ketosteroid isomerase-like protein
MSRLGALALVSMFGLFGCASPQASPDAVRQQVQDFVRKYVDDINKGDVTAVMELVSREQGVTSVNDGDISRGWDAIRTESDAMTGKEGSYKESVGSVDVLPLGGSYALAVAPVTIAAAAENGQVTQTEGAISLVLEKSKDGWKVIHEHYSSKAEEEGD